MKSTSIKRLLWFVFLWLIIVWFLLLRMVIHWSYWWDELLPFSLWLELMLHQIALILIRFWLNHWVHLFAFKGIEWVMCACFNRNWGDRWILFAFHGRLYELIATFLFFFFTLLPLKCLLSSCILNFALHFNQIVIISWPKLL